MTKSRLMAGASRFAHFSGLTRASARRAAEDDRREDDTAAEDDEEDRAEENEPSDDEPKGKKGRKAKRAEEDDADEGDDEKPKGKKSERAAEDDDEDGDDEPRARGKKSRRAEDDDDSDAEGDDDDKQEMTGRSAAASARRRERARCAAIFGHKAAAGNVALAASLAFETTMTRREAIAVMTGQAGRTSDAPARRSSREDRNPDLGASHGGDGKPKSGASWGRSFTKLGLAPRG